MDLHTETEPTDRASFELSFERHIQKVKQDTERVARRSERARRQKRDNAGRFTTPQRDPAARSVERRAERQISRAAGAGFLSPARGTTMENAEYRREVAERDAARKQYQTNRDRPSHDRYERQASIVARFGRKVNAPGTLIPHQP